MVSRGTHAHFSKSPSAVLKAHSRAKALVGTSMPLPWLAWFRLLRSPSAEPFCYCLWDYLLGLYLVKDSNKSLVQPHLVLVLKVPQDFIPFLLRLSGWNVFIRLPLEWKQPTNWNNISIEQTLLKEQKPLTFQNCKPTLRHVHSLCAILI